MSFCRAHLTVTFLPSFHCPCYATVKQSTWIHNNVSFQWLLSRFPGLTSFLHSHKSWSKHVPTLVKKMSLIFLISINFIQLRDRFNDEILRCDIRALEGCIFLYFRECNVRELWLFKTVSFSTCRQMDRLKFQPDRFHDIRYFINSCKLSSALVVRVIRFIRGLS